MKSLFKMPRVMPKIKASDLTGFKRSDFIPDTPLPKRRKRPSIKKIVRNI